MSMAMGDALLAFVPARAKRLPRRRHDYVLARARMERAGALTALYLKGSPYEMGYQHGALARGLIQRFRAEAYEYVATLVPVPRALAKPVLFYYASAYWKTLGADHVEELRGIAHGAGAHPVEPLVATAVWEMLLTHGCSEFAGLGPVTADDSLLHGYNYDLMLPEHAIIQPYLAAIFYEPDEGIPFATVNTVGTVGANAGINAEGISVAWDNTHLSTNELFQGIGGPIVPFIVTLRRLLQYARTIDDAVRIVVETLPRPLADIIIIGSAKEERAVALETAGRVHAVRPMQDGAIWSTNSFRSDTLAPRDHLGDWRSMTTNELWEKFPRYAAYDELYRAYAGKMDAHAAAAMLRDPWPREAEGYFHRNPAPRATITRNVTSFSMIMEPGKKRLWVSDAVIPGCHGRFFAFDLGLMKRLPDLDLGPSGFQEALRCADCFLKNDREPSRVWLDRAIGIVGETAPLLLMRALLGGLSGDETGARHDAERVAATWKDSPHARLAASWMGSALPDAKIAIPFPGATNPYLLLVHGADWKGRAVINTSESVVRIPERYLLPE